MGIQFTGLASGMDTQSIITDLMKVERMRVEDVEKDKILAEWKKEAWEDVNSKLYSFYKEELFDFKSAGTYSQKTLTNSNDSVVSLNTSTGAVRGSHTIDVTTMAKGSFLTGNVATDSLGATITSTTTAADMTDFSDGLPKTISLSLNSDGSDLVSISVEATDTMSDIINKVQALDLDLNVSYDSTYNRMFLSSTETGNGIQVQISGSDETLLTNMGFADVATLPVGSDDPRMGSAGADALFSYNGTELTNSANEITVNGLSFNIVGEGQSATVSVSQDTDAIYDSVKSFLLKYNELMLEMNTMVGADSAREYEPLTDDEKSAMTEDDIELWESKIKDSLLRRDDTLSGLTYSMRSTLTIASGVDTTNFTYTSISQLGIVTGNYAEGGLLHIEGDEEDSLYSSKSNKLRDALEDDPDAVMELLSSLGNEMYSNFQDRMKSTILSSALTFYNDKYMDTQIEEFEDDIYDLEDKMTIIEARYYKQFTAMEQAIQQSNSTGEWLAQQLAGLQ